MAKVAKRRGYNYRTTDLDYPAISVNTPSNAIGAKIGGGVAFSFGKSVDKGVTNLKNYYQSIAKSCPNSLWVLGGYSQGAIVVSRAIGSFKASKVLYVGLFGDPWTYLPEGKGLIPKACGGKGLSAYRIFAPDCHTYSGSLGMRNPYVPSSLSGKYGLWCNRRDYICGSTRLLFNNGGHTKYAEYNELTWMAEKVEKKLTRKRSLSISANQESVVGSDGDVGANTNEDGADGVSVNEDINADKDANMDEDINADEDVSSVDEGINADEDVSVDEDIDEIADLIEAHLSSDEYSVSLQGTVTLDASNSFSLGHEIVDYQWSINGEDFWSSGAEPTIQREVFFPEQYEVRLRIIDDAGRTAETTARIRVFEGTPVDNTMTAPREVTAEYNNGEITVH